MKCVLYGVMAAGLCTAANADLMNFEGQDCETINWNSVSMASDSAHCTVAGIGVTFETVDVSSDAISSNDFSNDAGFDALDFVGGPVESISIR